MTVVSTAKDLNALTLTFVAEFDAAVGRVWQLWEDPRQLERWWGPPGWPATFTRHEFTEGGESRYHMTGPDGTQPGGYWRIIAIQAPRRLVFEDGFTGADGEPMPDDPVHGVVTLDDLGGSTRMTVRSQFASVEQLTAMLAMGMEEGMRMALSQIDALLAGTA